MTLRGRLFAMTYDRQMAKVERAGLRGYRETVLAGATGRVLKIGGGTGANLPFYGPAVASLTLTEPETPMLRRLQRKVGAQAPAATVLRAPAEDLPFDDGSFDVAVSTLVLCGVDDQPRALRELRRGLRAGGQTLSHRARAFRRSAPGPFAGPDEQDQPVPGGLQLQPPDARLHRRSGLCHHADHAHRVAEGAEVRATRHRGQRYGSCSGAVPGRSARRGSPGHDHRRRKVRRSRARNDRVPARPRRIQRLRQ